MQVFRRIIHWLRTVRGARRLWQFLLLSLDAAAIVLATTITYLARFEGQIPQDFGQFMLPFTAASIVVYVLAAYLFGLYRVVLRYVGIDTLLRIVAATACAAAVLTIGNLAASSVLGYGYRLIPLGVLLIQSIFVAITLSGIRLTVRAAHHLRANNAQGLRTIIIGAGSAGALLQRDISQSRHLNIEAIGFLDDNPALRGALLGGKPVLGVINDLEKVAEDVQIEQVFVALPSADWQGVQQVLNRATDLGLQTRIMPKIVIEKGKVAVSDLRKIDVTDLLGRDFTPIDEDSIKATIAGKRVVVTGAAGSIGSELCRQLLAVGPESIALLEVDESRLYKLWFELEERSPGRTSMHIADIRDRDKLRDIFTDVRPQVVLHAAAYKQVPLMESEQVEAIHNNVVGTHNVMREAIAAGTERFVLISTDKAVAPASVMGKTKELAERLLLFYSESTEMVSCAVRFGNVLGSRGSVVPIFEEKLARNEALTVTDPEVSRYFMTIPEAARLVLQAQAIGQSGDVFLLEMGQPVKIVDLARKMIALSGAPADVVFTGLRPGEKLHESLITDQEELEDTICPGIKRIKQAEAQALDGRTLKILEEAVQSRQPVDRQKFFSL
ncbi:MAG: polysaccharide biosynthesis protein [Coriobacteriia bacterium]|nr:polysaccharide biosynthesis protein [Coriobacteriia bacterium]